MSYKVQKPCKVCGKMYTPCADCENDKTIFHWRTVACSYECGMKYFKMVEEARKPKEEKNEIETVENTSAVNEDNTDKVVAEKPHKKTTKTVNKVESEQIG